MILQYLGLLECVRQLHLSCMGYSSSLTKTQRESSPNKLQSLPCYVIVCFQVVFDYVITDFTSKLARVATSSMDYVSCFAHHGHTA